MLSRRRLLLGGLTAAGAGAAALLIRSCASRESVSATERVLRRGNGAEPESLDLHAARSEPAVTLLRDVYEGLTELGDDGRPHLAAAMRCVISADGREYRFTLRPQARWSNGEQLAADDFVAGWRRLVDPRTAAQNAGLLAAVRNARAIARGDADPATLGVSAVDAGTLRVELEQPTPYFLSVLTHPAAFPLHRASLQTLGRRFAKPNRLISNGAFRVTRWDFGSHLLAERNVNYWRSGASYFDAVEYYSFADSAQELRAYQAGQLDTTNSIPAAQYAWLRQHLPQELRISAQLAVYYLGFNMTRAPYGKPPAESRALRRALAMVIDRERLVESITGTGESPAYSFVPPGVAGYMPALPDYAGWPLDRRIAAARRLLSEAGFSAGPPLELEIRYNSSELHGRIALAVANMWKEALGIATSLRAEEYKALLQDVERGETQIFRASWVADYDDPQSFLQVLRGGYSINLPRYDNPRYDALLSRAAEVPDPAERASLLQRAEAAMLDDQPLIPLYFYVAKHLVGRRIRGWRDNPMNVVYSKNLSREGPATDASGNLRSQSLTSAVL